MPFRHLVAVAARSAERVTCVYDSFSNDNGMEIFLMFTTFHKALALGAVSLSAIVAATLWAAEPATKDCCEQKLACCKSKQACCTAEKKPGCCAKSMACCKQDKACCTKPPQCCVEGKECCQVPKACCDVKEVKTSDAPACCSATAEPQAKSCCAASDAPASEASGQ